MSAKGQNGGDCEDGETTIGRTCEGWREGVEESPRLPGQLLVTPVEDTSCLAGLLRLLVPEDAELFFGQALAGLTELTGYTGHGSLLSEMQDVAYTCHLTKEAGFQKSSINGRCRT